MTRAPATDHVAFFDAGIRYAAESIGRLLDDLALCTPGDRHCSTCDAYKIASATVAKWLDKELEGSDV